MKKNGLFFILLTLYSCVNKQDSSIESMDALYYNYTFESIVPISCNEIVKDIPKMDTVFIDDSSYMVNYMGVLDTIITDQSILIDIQKQLTLLQPKEVADNDIDARISVVIKYKNGKEDKLCIGGYLGDVINFKGKTQEPNRELLYLIKSSIGYYNWMTKKDMLYMDELSDTTFIRKPIESIENNPLMN